MHKVAIVGRPNVGKSSLYNRLIGRRDAVVADFPGVTRDAKEGTMLYHNHRITLIDTGGLWSGDEWEQAIREKAEWAMEGAQAVIFVLDPREGLSAADYEVAEWLRKLGRPVIAVANKIDSPKHEVYLAELWALGFGDPVPLSAEHARDGIDADALDDGEHDERQQDQPPVGENGREIERHRDGDEENAEQDAAERFDVGFELMAKGRFRQQHARKERAHRHREAAELHQ